MLEDLRTMLALMQGEYFLTNVLPYWVGFFAAMAVGAHFMGRDWR